jgi:hypothetical protein
MPIQFLKTVWYHVQRIRFKMMLQELVKPVQMAHGRILLHKIAPHAINHAKHALGHHQTVLHAKQHVHLQLDNVYAIVDYKMMMVTASVHAMRLDVICVPLTKMYANNANLPSY